MSNEQELLAEIGRVRAALGNELKLGGTVKDAIEWVRDLQAEVERLRELTSEVELGGVAVYRLVGKEPAERVDVVVFLTEFERLRAENADIAKAEKMEREERASLFAKVAKFEAENTELQQKLERFAVEIMKTRDRLDWFERYRRLANESLAAFRMETSCATASERLFEAERALVAFDETKSEGG